MVVCEVFQIQPNGPSNYGPHSTVVLQTWHVWHILISWFVFPCCCWSGQHTPVLLFPFLGYGCFQLPLPRCVVQPPGLSLALPAERCPLHLDPRQRREPGDAPVEGPVSPQWDADVLGWSLEFELCCQWWDLCHLGIYQGYSLLENHCSFPMFVEPPKLGLMMHVSWIHGYGIWSRILRPRQSRCSGASNCGCTLPDVSFPGLIIWSSYSYYLLEDPGKVRSCLSRSAGMALYCS